VSVHIIAALGVSGTPYSSPEDSVWCPRNRARPRIRKRGTEGDIVNCESDPGKLGSLSVSSYSSYSMRAIHYDPLGPLGYGSAE